MRTGLPLRIAESDKSHGDKSENRGRQQPWKFSPVAPRKSVGFVDGLAGELAPCRGKSYQRWTLVERLKSLVGPPTGI